MVSLLVYRVIGYGRFSVNNLRNLHPKMVLRRMVYNSWLFNKLVIRNPATSLVTLNRLVCSYRDTSRFKVHRRVVDRGLTLDEFKTVFSGADVWVLDDVGAYSGTSLEQVEFLLTGEACGGRPVFRAAENRLLSAERLRELVASPGGEAFAVGVIHNPNVPFDLLLRFAGSSDVALAYHVKVLLEGLSDDVFAARLRAAGFPEFVGLPRDWVVQVFTAGH